MSILHRVTVNIPASRKLEIDLPTTLPFGLAEVTITPHQVPAEHNRASGMDAGRVWIAEDFDDPLPDDMIAGFEGKR
jgi:hypothetical protein